MTDNTVIVKSVAMVAMYLIIMVTGNLPLRVKAFKENKKVLSIASAFSGGLFISIGLIHILPEAGSDFDKYYDSSEEHFPFQMFISVISFSFVLFIEKVIGEQFAHHHHHHHHDQNELEDFEKQTHVHNENHNHKSIEDVEKQETKEKQCNSDKQIVCELQLQGDCCQKNSSTSQNENSPTEQKYQQISTNPHIQNTIVQIQTIQNECKDFKPHSPNCELNAENQLSQQQQTSEKCPSEEKEDKLEQKQKQIKQVFEHIDLQLNQNSEDNKANIITPIILQIALGIHASLEGLAIGVEQDFSKCLTIALAVLVHKWAEGLVLGLALRQSKMSLGRATIMVAIQAAMNPMGIGIGWALSDAGDLTSGILMSISAGTFIYIATQEVIAQEFSKNRYQLVKFLFFLVGVGFISSLFFVEQATGG
ncbi:metal cation transporter, ZIP family protein (macronuclear) [Tetrahymena thermophila SB210]|uniref:Metal cation transporter, ZIP family protein n=1 Tax=Tetrahymena thermophila (strain SB210) TaxID=312017 RepID=Q23QR4_TETTS|nr:metal cation transporter, ZIP family protein [Tetrahymena thermophila SB210]EAR98824.1 metal cation transporter, ZIP family protein [Tetrahymena thermophila SB210]|eukprot:XP_001019069.1 metal cation transporter, ZIP family protein [Tetrahymena thermophila SB210]